MGALEQVREYLGLGRLPLHDGFTASERDPRLPVCATCGAVVAVERQTLYEQCTAVDPP